MKSMKKDFKKKKEAYEAPELFVCKLNLEAFCLVGSQETGIGGEGNGSDMDGFE